MKIDISKNEYRDLLDMLSIADWVLNSYKVEADANTGSWNRSSIRTRRRWVLMILLNLYPNSTHILQPENMKIPVNALTLLMNLRMICSGMS